MIGWLQYLFWYISSRLNSSKFRRVGLDNFAKTKKRYAGRNIISADKFGASLIELIEAGDPLMVARFGSTELQCSSMYEFSIKSKQQKSIDQLVNWSGFFPNSIEAGYQFHKALLESAKNTDLLGIWFRRFENYYIRKFAPSSCKLTFLFDIEPWRSEKYPWTSALKGKKVLVIHPFGRTIERQYKEKREEIFPGKEILPEFELYTLKAVQTIAGIKDPRFDTWFDALQYMYDEAMKIDFDVAILGCGAYGMPLASMLKSAGKQAIHLGGVTQILFGIKGKRWEETEDYKYIKDMMNDAWVYPDEEDTPKNAAIVEGGCYWK